MESETLRLLNFCDNESEFLWKDGNLGDSAFTFNESIREHLESHTEDSESFLNLLGILSGDKANSLNEVTDCTLSTADTGLNVLNMDTTLFVETSDHSLEDGKSNLHTGRSLKFKFELLNSDEELIKCSSQLVSEISIILTVPISNGGVNFLIDVSSIDE